MCRQEFSTFDGKEGEAEIKDSTFFHFQLDRLADLRAELEHLSGKTPCTNAEIHPCDLCKPPKDPQDATVRCLDCAKFLCETHETFHSELLSAHKVIDVGDYDEEEHQPAFQTVVPISKCSDHPQKTLKHLCTLCDVAICSHCVIRGKHKGHDSVPISLGAQTKRSNASLLIDSVEDRLLDIKTSLSSIDQVETKIQEAMISQKAKILDKAEELKEKAQKEIDHCKERLLQDLEDRSKGKIQRLAQQRKELEANLECLENSVKVSRSFVKNAPDDQLSAHLSLFSDQLTRLKEDTSFLQSPVEIAHLELNEGKQIDFDDILQEIQVEEKISSEVRAANKATKATLISRGIFRKRDYKLIKEPALVFGKSGVADGEFNKIWGITFDKINKRIIVADSANSRLQTFDRRGVHLQTFPLSFKMLGVAVHPVNGNIFVSGQDSIIHVLDDQGKELFTFGSKGAADGQIDLPFGLAFDKKNRLFICDQNNHRVQIFDDQGNHFQSFGTKGIAEGQFYIPYSVAFDKQNRAIIIDNTCRIQIFDEQGNHLRTFGTRGSALNQTIRPFSLTVDPNDTIIVCDNGNNRVQLFDLEGNHLTSIGTTGTADGQFQAPSCVALDHKGLLIVADQANNRVQIF